MSNYSMKIKMEDEEIILGVEKDDDITSMEIMLDTVDDKTLTKSKAMLMKVEVKGNIHTVNKDKLRKIFLWAKELEIDSAYCDVILEIKTGKSTPLRTYQLEKVFVCKYMEFYRDSNDNEGGDFGGTYEFTLVQKKNELDTINIL